MLLGNAIACCQTPCNGGLKVGVGCRWTASLLQMLAPSYSGMELQIARRLIMVG